MFGPKKLPEIARNIGKAMEYLRQTSQEFRDQVMRLDEETTKAVESAVADKTESVEQNAQNELPLGASEAYSPEDPYHNSEYYTGEESSASTTGDGGKSQENNELKLEENNAAKVDSNTSESPESIGGSEVKDANKDDGLAG